MGHGPKENPAPVGCNHGGMGCTLYGAFPLFVQGGGLPALGGRQGGGEGDDLGGEGHPRDAGHAAAQRPAGGREGP